MTVRGT